MTVSHPVPDPPVTERGSQPLVSSPDARITAIIHRTVGALAPEPREAVAGGDELVGTLGYDSLRMVELWFFLEELFSLDPSATEEIPSLSTVDEVVQFSVRMVDAGLSTVPEDDAVDAAFDSL